MDKKVREELNNVMKNLIEYLISKKIKWTGSNSKDGRINSSTWEKDILALLEEYCEDNNEIEYIKSDIRSWRDFQLKVKNKYDLPVNIKLTSVNKNGNSSNDNVGSKEGLIWTFSTAEPMNNRSWDSIKKIMSSPRIQSNRDYYFLIIDKLDTSDIWFTSFKQINSIIVNANNLPFQAKWTDNRELIEQTDLEAFKKLFKNFYKGLKILAERIESIPNPDDFNDKNS